MHGKILHYRVRLSSMAELFSKNMFMNSKMMYLNLSDLYSRDVVDKLCYDTIRIGRVKSWMSFIKGVVCNLSNVYKLHDFIDILLKNNYSHVIGLLDPMYPSGGNVLSDSIRRKLNDRTYESIIELRNDVFSYLSILSILYLVRPSHSTVDLSAIRADPTHPHLPLSSPFASSIGDDLTVENLYLPIDYLITDILPSLSYSQLFILQMHLNDTKFGYLLYDCLYN